MIKNSFKIFQKIKRPNGKRHVYFCGIKICSYKKKPKNKLLEFNLKDILAIQASYKIQEKCVQKKLLTKVPLNVAFLVTLPSMFPAKPLMERMCKDPNFKVSIVVIPDFRFGIERAKSNLSQCLKELDEFKDFLYVSPIENEYDTIDLKSIADVIFLPFCYDVSHSKYNFANIIKLGILPALVSYTFNNDIYNRNNLIASNEFGLFWKIFLDEEYSLDEFNKYSLLKGSNTVLTGYCKMDNYCNTKTVSTSKKKTIIIAPHHSIPGGFNDILQLSNFLKYADLFLKLPDIYSDIRFIFRPHPALLPVLESDSFWGKEKTKKYMDDMSKKNNVTISLSGDYFKEFSESDGIIQDCASFLTEYFWTKKPQCYLLKSPKDISSKFIPLGQDCLKHCYVSYTEQEILNFIDNVILKENDPKKKNREDFAINKLKVNCNNASENIIKYLKDIFYDGELS